MNSSLIFSIITSSLSAGIVGAILGHWLSGVRDRKQRLREIRIGYLIEIHRVFAKANRHPRLYEIGHEIEQALADIQLFGSERLIELVKRFTFEIAANRIARLDEIQQAIRTYLRQELGEKAITDRMFWLQINESNPDDSPSP
jgi:DUF1680 family protein